MLLLFLSKRDPSPEAFKKARLKNIIARYGAGAGKYARTRQN